MRLSTQLINISDEPTLGLKRKLKFIRQDWNENSKQISLHFRCYLFENNNGEYGNQISGNLELDLDNSKAPKTKILTASNNVKVNPQTGDIVQPTNEVIDGQPKLVYTEDYISELEYFKRMPQEIILQGNPIDAEEIISNIIMSAVLKADANGKFN